jgi:hypothetical protein
MGAFGSIGGTVGGNGGCGGRPGTGGLLPGGSKGGCAMQNVAIKSPAANVRSFEMRVFMVMSFRG